MPSIEIDSYTALDSLLANHPAVLSEAVFQGLDLGRYSPQLQEAQLTGCIFLGCQVDAALAGHLVRQGCFFMPPIRNKAYDPFRVTVYHVDELYAGFDWHGADLEASYRICPDYQIYNSFRDPQDLPVYPVMKELAQKGQFSHLIHLCDDLSQIEQLLSG